MHNGQKVSFIFDKVFKTEASQAEVFLEISELVQSALDGHKVCMFAYGQTGSGKTYTMIGKPGSPEEKGLIPRCIDQIFQMKHSLLSLGWKYNLKVSMLEIYKEDIFDLLVPKRSYSTDVQMASPSKRYGIKHDQYGNIEVSGLTIVDVCIENEVSNLLRLAAMRRSTGKTKMNQQSSRSHFVFTLRVSGVNERTQQNVEGVLNLIDLASSARFSKSEVTEVQLKETQAINKSLFHLRKAISSLANKEGHVPFRDSKLTYILQPCLCGDSKALMFVNISSDPTSSGESLCSLRFAENVNTCELRGRRLYGNWHGV
ncbi:kinesin-like protein KIN-14C isoform X2 [Punica granatum]|nr:kinesin-like protein KIN-14C isoform X2 [Punica granatum]XP_031371425.1 kinesin-like protein KIN-14C isoform X2 [Punica granatum]